MVRLEPGYTPEVCVLNKDAVLHGTFGTSYHTCWLGGSSKEEE